MRFVYMLVFTAVLSALTLGAASMQGSFSGAFALQDARPQTQAHMVATQVGASPLHERLDLWLTGDNSETLRRYSVDMTKYLHLIAISDDFSTFLHVHPRFERDDHFRIDISFPKSGLYHVYADSTPTGIGQQVFRYDLQVGRSSAISRAIVSTGSRVSAGPYRVSLASTRLHVKSENVLTLHITKSGKPANDLHPYLGALAHAVFVDARDLSYAHVHPMPLERDGATSSMSGPSNMSGMESMAMPEASKSKSQVSSPDMVLHVKIYEAGTYKLWLQFRGGNSLYAAPFVLLAA